MCSSYTAKAPVKYRDPKELRFWIQKNVEKYHVKTGSLSFLDKKLPRKRSHCLL